MTKTTTGMTMSSGTSAELVEPIRSPPVHRASGLQPVEVDGTIDRQHPIQREGYEHGAHEHQAGHHRDGDSRGVRHGAPYRLLAPRIRGNAPPNNGGHVGPREERGRSQQASGEQRHRAGRGERPTHDPVRSVEVEIRRASENGRTDHEQRRGGNRKGPTRSNPQRTGRDDIEAIDGAVSQSECDRLRVATQALPALRAAH